MLSAGPGEGGVLTVVGGFEFSGWNVPAGMEQALAVEPVDVGQGGDLHLLGGAPGPAGLDQSGLCIGRSCQPGAAQGVRRAAGQEDVSDGRGRAGMGRSGVFSGSGGMARRTDRRHPRRWHIVQLNGPGLGRGLRRRRLGIAWIPLPALHAVLRVGVGGRLAGGGLAAHCHVLCSWIVPITSAVIPGQPGSHPSLGKSAGWLSCLAGSVRAVTSAWAVVAAA